jgi:glycosyltransferase involved in cell wall biosynthesis
MVAPLRVCIDARLGADGLSGGVQQVVVGLASGLAEVDDGREEYHFLVDGRSEAWLRPSLLGPCRVLAAPEPCPTLTTGLRNFVKGVAPAPVVDLLARGELEVRGLLPWQVPWSDGTIERAGIEVLHQTLQSGFRTQVPCIYMPYDLQHLHLPRLFSARLRRRKGLEYPALANAAEAVVAISHWGKDDLVRAFGLRRDKVRVVHLAPAVDGCPEPTQAELAASRERLGIDGPFAFYPAQTWPHKNHLGLLDALAWLRDHASLRVPVVFCGHQNAFFPSILRRVRKLRLEDQVRFVGFVSPVEVKALYRLARLLVFPSLFEGFGMPVVEAFRMGVPVACSNATSLPEVAGDAAVLFDPADPAAMARAIAEVWTSEARRRQLVERGLRRGESFSWAETARRFRALYRLIGRRPLDDRDRALLDGSL